MAQWRMAGEPSLTELLADEIMARVMHADGLDEAHVRSQLTDLADRLDMAPRCSRGRAALD
jgi:hypothetical protein